MFKVIKDAGKYIIKKAKEEIANFPQDAKEFKESGKINEIGMNFAGSMAVPRVPTLASKGFMDKMFRQEQLIRKEQLIQRLAEDAKATGDVSSANRLFEQARQIGNLIENILN